MSNNIISINRTLSITQRQEPFSIAYVKAIAHAAGYGVKSADQQASPDIKSIDLEITQYGEPDIEDLRVQVKCCYANGPGKTHFSYELKKKNYNDIVKNKNPHILAVVHVPRKLDDWIFFSGSSIELRYNCYWMSLKGLDKTDKDSKTVHIPLHNRLDVNSLTYIMDLLYEGKFVLHDNTEVEM